MFMRLSLGCAVALALLGCPGPPSQIEFVSVTPEHPQLTDIATLVFRLEDYRGIPQAGTNVSFRLTKNTPGVTLSPSSVLSDKGSGEVRVQIAVSGIPATVQVIADAGGGKVAFSPPITFAGSFANARQLTFQCGPFGTTGTGGIHAIGAYDPSRHLLDGIEVDCWAHVADKNGDGLPNINVSFLTEAGTISPSSTTGTDHEGIAIATHKVTFPLPHQTDPDVFSWSPVNNDTHTGNYLVPLWMEPFSWTANPLATLLTGNPAYSKTMFPEPQRKDPVVMDNTGNPLNNNPRDNLVTLIAFTNGEEGYTDVNGDGKYTDGEPFDDLTEPFVDSNDNGTWDGPNGNCVTDPRNETSCVQDTGEKFIDTNGNGTWDGKNGQWDANTTIWVAERITWTGIPYQAAFSNRGEQDDYSGLQPTVFAAQLGFSSPPPPIRVHCNEHLPIEFPIADPWWNTIAQNSEGDGCAAQQGLGMKVVDAAGSFQGIRFDYPPIRDYSFVLADALPRMPAPMTSPPQPACFELGVPLGPGGTGPFCDEVTTCKPIKFYALVNCTFTATPKSGYKTVITAEVDGLISNNYP